MDPQGEEFKAGRDQEGVLMEEEQTRSLRGSSWGGGPGEVEEALGRAGTGQDTTRLPGDRQQRADQLRAALSSLTSPLLPGRCHSVPPSHHTAEPSCILLGTFTLKRNEDFEPSGAEPCNLGCSICILPAAAQCWDTWQSLQCLS